MAATDWWNLAGDAASWLGNTANSAANYLTNNTAPYLALSGWNYLADQKSAENVKEEMIAAEKQGLQYLGNQTNAGINYAQNQNTTGINYLGNQTDAGIQGATAQTQAGLGSLNQGIDQGVGAVRETLSPYAQFGQQGMNRYSGLLADPSSITNDPGYLFRMQQGQQALERSAAAKGGLLSGGTGIDLSKYGQDYATAEYDKSLGRSLPMIETGLQASGQMASNLAALESTRGTTSAGLHENLGNTIAQMRGQQGTTGAGMYSQLGQTGAEMRARQGELGMGSYTRQGEAGATEEMLKMMNRRTLMEGLTSLYGGGNQQGGGGGGGGVGAPDGGSGLSNVVSGAKDLYSGAKNLLGIGAPTVTGGAAAAGINSALGGMTGVGAVGSVPYSAAGAMSPAVNAAAGNALTGSTATNAVAGQVAAGQIGFGTAMGLAAMPLILNKLTGLYKSLDGSQNSAKVPKLAAQLQRDQAADPSGRTAQATLSKLINGKLWAGEDNGEVMKGVLDSGAISWEDPAFYGKNSTFNMFGDTGSTTTQGLGPVYTNMSYGMTKEEAVDATATEKKMSQYLNMHNSRNKDGDQSSIDYKITPEMYGRMFPEEGAKLAKYNAMKTPARQQSQARKTRAKILRANPNADVTKLNQFLRSA